MTRAQVSKLETDLIDQQLSDTDYGNWMRKLIINALNNTADDIRTGAKIANRASGSHGSDTIYHGPHYRVY